MEFFLVMKNSKAGYETRFQEIVHVSWCRKDHTVSVSNDMFHNDNRFFLFVDKYE